MTNATADLTEESNEKAPPALYTTIQRELRRFLATLEAIYELVELTPSDTASDTAFDRKLYTPLQRLIDSASEAVPTAKEAMREGTDRAWNAFIQDFHSQVVAYGDSEKHIATDHSAEFIKSAEYVCQISEGQIEIRAFTHACMDTFVSKGAEMSVVRKGVLLETLLSACVSAYESLFASIAGRYFENVPEAMGIDVGEFSLRTLLGMKDISEAIEQAIDQRVDDVLRKGFDGQVAWLQDKERLGLDPSSHVSDWDRLYEAIERRHCIVHHGSNVSTQYVRKVRNTALNVGDRLTVDQQYISKAIDDFAELGVHIAIATLRKLKVSGDDELVNFVREEAYEALKDRRWKVALALCALGSELSSSHLDKNMFRVNVWLCHKRLFGLDYIKTAVESWDTGAKKDVFAFAKEVLLDHFDLALEMAISLLESGSLTTSDLLQWPILAELRQHRDFEEKIEIKVAARVQDEADALNEEPLH
jgi:hypothetical protein